MPPTGSHGLPLNTIGSAATLSAHPEEERIWTRILSEVSSKCPSNAPQGSVLFLGDSQCGKSWLLSRLDKREVSRRGSALEYHFLTVHNDYRDSSYAYQLSTAGTGVAPGESVTLPVWILDGDAAFSPLIKFALTSSLARTVVVLCASFSHPEQILVSLKKWSKVIDAQIQHVFDKATISEARKAQELFWQEYLEPLDSSMHSDKIPSMETEQILLPLHQNVLTSNSGAALIVVLTKSDLSHSELSDEQLDRVQYHVRKFCMRHGAALIYTSAKEEKNTALLYKYLIHRICGAPFTNPAILSEKDSIFIPAGFDNDKKLDIIKEVVHDPERPLEIPREWQPLKDQMIEAEEEQSFLQKLTNIELSSPKRMQTQKPPVEGADGNSPLVSFFNNLLKTKEGQSAVANRTIVDPQTQLQRMVDQTNISASAGSSSANSQNNQYSA